MEIRKMTKSELKKEQMKSEANILANEIDHLEIVIGRLKAMKERIER